MAGMCVCARAHGGEAVNGQFGMYLRVPGWEEGNYFANDCFYIPWLF